MFDQKCSAEVISAYMKSNVTSDPSGHRSSRCLCLDFWPEVALKSTVEVNQKLPADLPY